MPDYDAALMRTILDFMVAEGLSTVAILAIGAHAAQRTIVEEFATLMQEHLDATARVRQCANPSEINGTGAHGALR